MCCIAYVVTGWIQIVGGGVSEAQDKCGLSYSDL